MLQKYISDNLTWEKVGGKMIHVLRSL